MRYKLPPDFNVRRPNPEALEFISQLTSHSVSDFIPAQRKVFRRWQLAFNRALKHLPNTAEMDGPEADAELLLFFFARFKDPYADIDNVLLLHPPTVFEKLEWALQNVLGERVVGNLLPFSRERRHSSVLAGMKSWSLSGETDAEADCIRQAVIKLILTLD